MVAEHLIVTGYMSGVAMRATLDPSDIRTVGLSTDGYITVDATAWDQDGILIRIYSGDVNDSGSTYLGDYYFANNIKTKLSDAYPGIALDGCYLGTDTFMGSDEDRIPIRAPYTACGDPAEPALTQDISREAVTLSWGAGEDGTNNSVTGYDVQRRESTDGSSWGSWETVSGSPVTGTSLDVTPPGTVGNYYQYRVRTRGSAGSDYYSGWVTSTNTLRRKWNAFGAWTDASLTAGVSSIRAVHLTQIQERVAAIRAFYGLSAYSFTAVTARQTKIAQWAALIGELREAIDGITTNHAAWNTMEAGKPRIAHITQLRDIIDNM